MLNTNRPGRAARLAASGLSSGVLVMIWTAVWYAAVVAGKSASADWQGPACGVGFVLGLLTAGGSFLFLRSRRLSLADGSVTHESVALRSPAPHDRTASRRPERLA